MMLNINKILSGMHNDSDEVLLAILDYGFFTNCSKRLRLASPSAKLLWIIMKSLPTSSTIFSRHSG